MELPCLQLPRETIEALTLRKCITADWIAVFRPVNDMSEFWSFLRMMGSSSSVGSPYLASNSKYRPRDMVSEFMKLEKKSEGIGFNLSLGSFFIY